jgi:L-alanine-DL-glutamate epimerase-like enolase superfamily enzyme
MEITDVQACVIKGFGEWILVKVYTDSGIHGIGEAYPSHSMGRGTKEIIHGMRWLLVGEDPRDVERLTQKVLRTNVFSGGTSGIVVNAMSGVEIALWDLAGKVAGLPVYRLLGSKYRDSVRVYTDLDPKPFATESNPWAAAARAAVDKGFDALKIDLRGVIKNTAQPWNRSISQLELQGMVERVRVVRDALGAQVDLAVDLHTMADMHSARRLARCLEPFDLLWLEDPLPPENPAAMALVTQSTSTPICTGESLYTAQEFRDLIMSQAVDIVSPDIPKTGGLVEARKIAYLADMYYINLAPHNTSSAIGSIASAHACATIPNFLALEYHGEWAPQWHDVIHHERPIIEDGAIHLTEKPGLGIDINRDAVRALLLDGEELFD